MSCGHGRWFTTRDPNNAKDRNFAEGSARDEDAIGVAVEVRRRDLDAIVDQAEQVVGDDAFEGIAIQKAKAQPEAIEFGPAQEGFALRLEVVVKIADKINRPNLGEGKLLMFTGRGQQIERVDLPEARRIQVAAEGFAVQQGNDDLFVGRGWGSEFQRRGFAPRRETDLHIMELYVMLSANFLSSHCF